jgi:uncharacterized protein
MKYSQFNALIAHEEDKFALYNSFNNKVLFLVPELKDLMEAAIREGIDNLYDIHPTFYDYLVAEGFLIDNEVDEVNKLKILSKSIDENTDTFLLTINPTMNCNFKCWYCYETHIKASKAKVDMIDRINKFVSATTSKPELLKFSLSFFGGEPLLYFDKVVIPIIDFFVDRVRERKLMFDISFTTNGYLINQAFIDYFTNKNIKCSVQITLDGYKEDHDKVRYVSAKKGSYTEIIQNVRLMVLNRFHVRLRINYTDKSIGNASKIADEFADIPQEITNDYLFFDYHRVWQDNKLDNTSEILEENLVSVREKGLIAEGGYSANNVLDSCYADKRNSAVINYNGDLYKCTARDFKTENRAGFINENGELIWENDYLERRMNAKFKNKPCLSCKIMPLCNGGCSQHAMERIGEDYCVYMGDEEEKNKVVRAKIQDIINHAS